MKFIRAGSKIQDPGSKIAERSFPVILDPEPRPKEFYSVSFGFIRAPGSKIAVKDLSAILDLGSHPNEFHSVSFGFIRGTPQNLPFKRQCSSK